MLTITIPEIEEWDEVNECFRRSKAQTLQLEHSLVSISKWEMKWKLPFLSDAEGLFLVGVHNHASVPSVYASVLHKKPRRQEMA